MSLIGGIVAARRHLFTWFGGLALSAKAGIATAAFVTMSAGVVIGVPYTPTSAPWLTPNVAPYETVQTPSPLRPSIVEAATPTPTVVSTREASRMGPVTTTTASPGKTASAATAALQTSASAYYTTCAQASKAGAAPITSGQPGYRIGLDPNRNGIACESK